MNLNNSEFIKDMHEVMVEVFDQLLNPAPSIKMPDWPMFNKLTGGLRMHEFTIICGSTGSGKTSIVSNISAQLIKCNVKHFVMSIETGHVDFMTRVTSIFAKKDLNALDYPMSPEEASRILTNNQKNLMTDLVKLSTFDNRVKLEVLLDDLTNMCKEGCKVAIIDNLNFLLEVTRSSEAIIEMDRVVHELIMFCKRNEMHLILIMHPKKTEGTRVMSEYDIKGSSTAVQEAQNVLLWNRPDPKTLIDLVDNRGNIVQYASNKPHYREMFFAKMRRRGMHAGKTLKFEYNETVYNEVTHD